MLRLDGEREEQLLEKDEESEHSLGGNLSRIPLDVWREHVCPFLDHSWRGWAKMARVSKGWLLRFRFAQSLTGDRKRALTPSALRRSGLRGPLDLRKLEQIIGFQITEGQELLASLVSLQTLDLTYCNSSRTRVCAP